MKAFKLCRLLSDGNITPLFINKKQKLPFNVWMDAESHPTKGYAYRPYWHCTSLPIAPHLKKEGRVWVECEIEEYSEFIRPDSQGGKWYLAGKIKLLNIVDKS